MNKRRLLLGSLVGLTALLGGSWLAISRFGSSAPDPVKTLFGLTFNDAEGRPINFEANLWW
jgi:hypothetical protein